MCYAYTVLVRLKDRDTARLYDEECDERLEEWPRGATIKTGSIRYYNEQEIRDQIRDLGLEDTKTLYVVDYYWCSGLEMEGYKTYEEFMAL